MKLLDTPEAPPGFWQRLFGKRKEVHTPAPQEQPQPKPVAPNGKRILLVDDDPVILKTTGHKFEAEGYRVIRAMDPAEAMEVTRLEDPDLMLLDIEFPPDVGAVDWDGYLMMSWLQRRPEFCKTPIIIISGHQVEEQKLRAMAAGAIAFFQKPIDHRGLLRTIARILGRRSGMPQISGLNL